MNNSPHITPEEWDRIRKYIAEGPSHVHLDTSAEGTCIVFGGRFSGVIHPRAYLQIMEDDYQDLDLTPVDILKHVSNATAPEALIGTMPGYLRGKPVPPKG
jgi:hypothetical protein